VRDLTFYEDNLKTREPFGVNFTGIDNENLLFWTEEGDENNRLRIELPLTDLFGNYTKERRRNYHVETMLLHEIMVIVSNIDKKKGVVSVSFSEAGKILRVREREETEKKLSAGEKIDVVGRVVAMKGHGWGSHAVVRPLKSNLVLMLPVAWFSTEFVNDIHDVCKIGMPIDVRIVPKKGSGYKNTSAYDFLCTRKNLLPDPWENIADRIHLDDIVTVMVTGSRRKGKNPASPSVSDQTDMACVIEGINVNGYVSVKSNMRLEAHHKYLAVVNSIDIPRKRIRLVAFRLKREDDSKL
jgi:hypothetical protein